MVKLIMAIVVVYQVIRSISPDIISIGIVISGVDENAHKDDDTPK